MVVGQIHLCEVRVAARRLVQLCHRDASGPISMAGSPQAGQPLLSPLPAEPTCSPGTCCSAGHLLCPPLPGHSVQLLIPLERPCGFGQKGYFLVSSKSAGKNQCQLPLSPCWLQGWCLWAVLLGRGTPWPGRLHSPHLLRASLSPGSSSSVTLACPARAGRLLQLQSSGKHCFPHCAQAWAGHPGRSGHALSRAGAADPGRSFSIVQRPG